MDVKIARNDYEQRVLEFKQELYKAMSSIEDALALRHQLWNRRRFYVKARNWRKNQRG